MFSHRRVPYLSHAVALANKLSDCKEERLPPPRVNQSTVGLSSFPGTTTKIGTQQYDKVGLSRKWFLLYALQFIF